MRSMNGKRLLLSLASALALSLVGHMAAAQGAVTLPTLPIPCATGGGAGDCTPSRPQNRNALLPDGTRPEPRPDGRADRRNPDGSRLPPRDRETGSGPRGGHLRRPDREPRETPFVGEGARHSYRLNQGDRGRLPPAPPRQHYRVMNDNVVRVDDLTLEVVAVLGPAGFVLGSH